jgi:2-oxoisovalerate dehydrogenase E1 component beta subunit
MRAVRLAACREAGRPWRAVGGRRALSALADHKALVDNMSAAAAAQDYGPVEPTNMCNAINSAMRVALETNDRTAVFGEDVGFGGVFRCTVGLRDDFGGARVFNTPLCEQGIAGFAIGLASQVQQRAISCRLHRVPHGARQRAELLGRAWQGWDAVAEIQFADYIFPAFDQITNGARRPRASTRSRRLLQRTGSLRACCTGARAA